MCVCSVVSCSRLGWCVGCQPSVVPGLAGPMCGGVLDSLCGRLFGGVPVSVFDVGRFLVLLCLNKSVFC